MISIGAGVRNAGVILQRDDLVRALQPEIGDFVDKAQGHQVME